MVLLLAKQIITLYHAVQKTLTKDQHALVLAKNVDQATELLDQHLLSSMKRIEEVIEAA